MTRLRSAREAEQYLLSLINYEARPHDIGKTKTRDIEHFRDLLLSAGWKPGDYPTIHIGGTNGKGTVAALLARCLHAGGWKAGLYTSPHLIDIRERVQINGRKISKTAFTSGVQHLKTIFDVGPGAGFRTTFEHLTALALLYFQLQKVDAAVVEVGLGGRLDATNVVPPGHAILTPVGLDHRHVLGDTLGAIAADKAHIFKNQGTAWVTPQKPGAWKSIQRRLKAVGVRPRLTSQEVTVTAVSESLAGTRYRIRGKLDYGVVPTRLFGRHQEDNIAAVTAVVEDLLDSDDARRAVSRGLRNAHVPGRLQVFAQQGQTILVDGGHNAPAARAMVQALKPVLGGREAVRCRGYGPRQRPQGVYVGSLSDSGQMGTHQVGQPSRRRPYGFGSMHSKGSARPQEKDTRRRNTGGLFERGGVDHGIVHFGRRSPVSA